MPRKFLAPFFLLLAAALSVAAVFMVHKIEASGGPLAEPYATRYLAPGNPAARSVGSVRFTTQKPEIVTVVVRDMSGDRVATIAEKQEVSGATEIVWDGRAPSGEPLPDGEYKVVITRAGDNREYSPALTSHIDTKAPRVTHLRSSLHSGYWRGVLFIEPGTRLIWLNQAGEEIPAKELGAFATRISNEPDIVAPDGLDAYRFTVRIDDDRFVRIAAKDRAENMIELDPDLIEQARK